MHKRIAETPRMSGRVRALSMPIGLVPLTIPYSASHCGHSINHGFFDTKGRPDLVARIPEASGWPELAGLLRVLNSAHGDYRSLGCDVGFLPHRDGEAAGMKTKVASTIEIAYADPALNADPSRFARLMERYAKFEAGPTAAEASWSRPTLLRTCYRSEGIRGWCVSLGVVGIGRDRDSAKATWAAELARLEAFAAARSL